MISSLVSTEWLNENIDNPKLIVLDASIISKLTKETKYPEIQIRNARFFDIKNAFSDQKSELPNTIPSPEVFTIECQKLGIHQDSIIVVYDNLGIYSSPRAWFLFKVMGFKNVAVLDGGLPDWVEKGCKTELNSTKTYSSGNFLAKFQSELVVSKEDILENLQSQNALVLDARLKTRFNAEVTEPRAGLRSGHIPNSLCFPYETVLKDGFFLPKEELKDVISELGLNNTPLIFSCGSGITACIILFACHLVLDNTIVLYDGSWTEWGANPQLPISK